MAALAQVCAIDPGLKGALAWVNEAGYLLHVEDMPLVNNEVSAALLVDLIPKYGPVEAVIIEKQQAFPKRPGSDRGQGVASTFKTGTGYGILIGVTAGLRIPAFYWPSAMWKKTLRLSANKEYSRQRALERWPEPGNEFFKLKKHEGRAEAALLGATWFLSKERRELLPPTPPPPKARRLIRRYPEGHLATVAGLEHT